MILHHPGRKSQPKPTDKLENHMARKTQQMLHKKKKKQKATSRKRLIQFEVSEFLVKNNIHRHTELFYEANKRKEEGQRQTDLASFVLSSSSKYLNDPIENTWKTKNRRASIKLEKTTRMEILMKCQSESCVDSCDMKWYECARQVLQLNNISPFVFADAMSDLLAHGRGKFRNIMIVAPANCGKTFLLKPLEIIFRAFTNPANDKYVWFGADQAEVIVLQDFRWSSELICWKDLLLLLEGKM